MEMDNIYRQIDAIFVNELEQPPIWAKELIDEIKTLKETITQHEKNSQKRGREFYRFIREFRKSMYADTEKKIYPKIIDYRGRKLGVNFDGLLYDISTSKVLNTQDAFKVYGYLYKKKNFEVFY